MVNGPTNIKKSVPWTPNVGFFKNKWTGEYIWIYEGKDLCLICSASIAFLEGSNVAEHYNLKHKEMSKNCPCNEEKNRQWFWKEGSIYNGMPLENTQHGLVIAFVHCRQVIIVD